MKPRQPGLLRLLVEDDLFRKPVSTFRDHARRERECQFCASRLACVPSSARRPAPAALPQFALYQVTSWTLICFCSSVSFTPAYCLSSATSCPHRSSANPAVDARDRNTPHSAGAAKRRMAKDLQTIMDGSTFSRAGATLLRQLGRAWADRAGIG